MPPLHLLVFSQLSWFDGHASVINDAKYSSDRMPNSKLYSARSAIILHPTRALHNATFKCEAWNEAGRARPALVRFNVEFSPSVGVVPVRPGVAREGEELGFRCATEANPPVQEDRYKWYIGDELQAGQTGAYFEIARVTRQLHGKQIKCSAVNSLGIATGVKTIQVHCKQQTATQNGIKITSLFT